MDAFYTSVEQRDNPALRNKPIVVGGPQKRGVIAAASYEARKYGVYSAMPGQLALKKCPSLVFVAPRFEVYKQVSQDLHEIFRCYTDIFEPLALDEAFLDVTQNKVGERSASIIGQRIRAHVKNDLNLTVSAGVSYNKFLAKIASDWKKPDGIFTITPKRAIAFIEELPVEKFFGVGKKTAEKMHRHRIFKGKDIKAYDQIDLIRMFGKAGDFFYKIARGIDDREVRTNREHKSIGAERTYATNLQNHTEASEHLERIVDLLWQRIQKKKSYGQTLTLKIKYSDFTQITRSESSKLLFLTPKMIEEVGKRLLQQEELYPGVRLLGLSVSNFKDDEETVDTQLTFDF